MYNKMLNVSKYKQKEILACCRDFRLMRIMQAWNKVYIRYVNTSPPTTMR